MRLGALRVMAAQLALELEWTPGAATPWEVLDERGRGASFLRHPVRTVLNSPESTGMGFWSLNPYVGCEFGCTYCYARDTHRWAVERIRQARPDLPAPALPPAENFERRILVKVDAADRLARTLEPARLAGRALVIGTATDPYQPAERRFGVTRRVLEALLGYRGLRVGLITKSPLVARDADLLVRLAERHDVTINLSVATADPVLARRLERRSPVPAARFRALGQLTGRGLDAGVMVAPIVPGITDGMAQLRALCAAARDAGARFLAWAPLRLGPAARASFLPHVGREFPELAARYRRHYGRHRHAPKDYVDALRARLAGLREEFGLAAATR